MLSAFAVEYKVIRIDQSIKTKMKMKKNVSKESKKDEQKTRQTSPLMKYSFVITNAQHKCQMHFTVSL